MTIETFRGELEGLAEPACVEGTSKLTERLSIAVDGDVAALDDPNFIEWLLGLSEVAPFGHGGKTKVDKGVRDAMRVKARGKALVAGFDPATILDAIEAVLSPHEHLEAKLTDIVTYPTGGKFAKHKDTPRDANLVGTLVVGLPIAHAGGQLVVTEDGAPRTIDWAGAPDPESVRWVAMFSDADHEVKTVASGTRVTLVYSLSLTKQPRTAERNKALVAAAKKLKLTKDQGPLMIACTRQVITAADAKAVQPIDVLRGTDRELADALVENGFKVGVRSCILDAEKGVIHPVDDAYSIARLSKAIPPKVMNELYADVVTFGDSADYDGEEIEDAVCLAPYILDRIDRDHWVVRKNAASTLVGETEAFSADGYFGNEGYEAHIYTLAALEVTA